MDALALALKEVTAESNQARSKLSDALSELRSTKAEAEHLRSSLSLTEQKFREAKSESQRLKQEAEEVFSTWHEKEKGFISCVKASEDEMKDFRQQNKRLMEFHRASREEILKLRDILKQAVNEATVVKEALEIAREENSHLQDLLQEKEHVMKVLKQEHECLKVSEANAIDSVKELKGLIAATSHVDDSSRGCGFRWIENTPLGLPRIGGAQKTMAKYPSEKWRTVESPLLRNALLSLPRERRPVMHRSSSPGVKGVN